MTALLLMLQILPQSLFAAGPTPVIDVTGFKVTNMGGDVYRFEPLCGSGTCTKGQLSKHTYIWDFRNCRYHVDSIVTLTFPGTVPDSVELRVTNIYEEDDPDATEETIHTTAPDANRVTHTFTEKVNLKRYMVLPPVADPNAYIYGYDHVPAPDYKMYYKIVFANPWDCPITFTAILDGTGSGGLHPQLLGGEDAGSVTINAVSPAQAEITKSVGKYDTCSVIIQYDLPATMKVGDILMQTLQYEYSLDSACQGREGNAGEDSRQDEIVTSIDPNLKKTMGDRCFYYGDAVTYRIEFENMGTIDEDKITIIDTFDARFDFSLADIYPVAFRLNGAVPAKYHVDTTVNRAERIGQWEISLDALSNPLQPGDIVQMEIKIPLEELDPCPPNPGAA
ncbi:MAG: hypothetical protein AAF570_22870, partial [Bacteroidota bacterium]